MKTNSLLRSRPLALGLAALLLPAARAAEPAAPAVGALTLEASPTARGFALSVPTPVAAIDPRAGTPRRSSPVLRQDPFDRDLSDSFPLHDPVREPAVSPETAPASLPSPAPAVTPAPRSAVPAEAPAATPAPFDWSVPVVAPAVAASAPSPADGLFTADTLRAPARMRLALDAPAPVLPAVVPTAVGLAPAAGLTPDAITRPWDDYPVSPPINPPATGTGVGTASSTQANLVIPQDIRPFPTPAEIPQTDGLSTNNPGNTDLVICDSLADPRCGTGNPPATPNPTPNPTPAVPEPATWLGGALVGGLALWGMRRRFRPGSLA